MASALTKPVITDRETKRISRPSLSRPAMIWKTPIRMVAANRYWTPWSCTSAVMRTAVEAVAAEIMAARPPVKAMTHGDHHRGIEADLGIDAGDHRKADRLGYEGERDDEAGQQIGAGVENHSRLREERTSIVLKQFFLAQQRRKMAVLR